jgi:hypothetical protein
MKTEWAWTKRALLQLEIEHAQGLDKRLAEIIKGEPNPQERENLLDVIAMELGGKDVEEVERILKRK